jgi:hypothetical protein
MIIHGWRSESTRQGKNRGKTTKMTKIRPKRYIVWSTNKEIDLSDPWQRKWYIGEVLSNGRAEDIAELDWDEVRKILPELNLPKRVRRLWEDYFQHA